MRKPFPLAAGAALLGFVLAHAAAKAQPTHPLDALTPEEIRTAVALLRADGKVGDATRFPLIELHEPPKETVLAWSAPAPLPRTARVLVKTGAITHDALVDLVANRVTARVEAAGEPMILLEEFLGATEAAITHPEMVAGLAKRGLVPDQVFCLPLTAGNFLDGEADGRRLMKVPCYVKPDGTSNWYAKPVEGLFATVELNTRQVLAVVDEGVVPIATDPWGYTSAEIEPRFGLRPPSQATATAPANQAPFTIEGSTVAWDMWRFHLRADKRPGLVLSRIEAKDGDRWRSVLYQAHLSEVFVPYMDPGQGYYWRTYMDSGEYGFGLFLSPLKKGADCPSHATFLPVGMATDEGEPFEIPDAICIFERRTGDAAWRHFEIFEQSPTTFVPAESRPAVELVVRSASQVGNYDYFIDYVFERNGQIRILIGATGLDAVKGVPTTSMTDPTADQDTRWGTLIAPNLVASNHDHFFNFRLDFDLDGRSNSFMRTEIVPAEIAPGARRRSLWTTRSSMPMTEDEAAYRLSYERPAMYHVMNHGVTGSLGHHPGWMLVPMGSVAYSPLDVANDPPARRNAYIDKTFWVTPHDPKQRYAGGEFAMQSDGSDTLAEWIKAGRSIHDTDIVVWASLGFHHIPHMEDWPVMSTSWKGLVLKPFNFFARNPAITIRPEE